MIDSRGRAAYHTVYTPYTGELMASKVKEDRTNYTKPSMFRLGSDVLEQLNQIAEHYGLGTRTAAIRFLAAAEAKKIGKKTKDLD